MDPSAYYLKYTSDITYIPVLLEEAEQERCAVKSNADALGERVTELLPKYPVLSADPSKLIELARMIERHAQLQTSLQMSEARVSELKSVINHPRFAQDMQAVVVGADELCDAKEKWAEVSTDALAVLQEKGIDVQHTVDIRDCFRMEAGAVAEGIWAMCKINRTGRVDAVCWYGPAYVLNESKTVLPDDKFSAGRFFYAWAKLWGTEDEAGSIFRLNEHELKDHPVLGRIVADSEASCKRQRL